MFNIRVSSKILVLFSLTAFFTCGAHAEVAEPAELYCTIRDNNAGLNCQWAMKDKNRIMTPEDISSFVDQGAIAAYLTVKSRRGNERVFMVDSHSPQYKKLADIKNNGSVSEISRVKNEIFTEIEKKIAKISDDLDAQMGTMELIKYDPSVGYDKGQREMRAAQNEITGYRKNRDKVCTSTPAFEQLSKANSSLQQTLSNILYAFQTSDSCMKDFKVFKDKDGTVDLRQLDGVSQHFIEKCKVAKVSK